VVEAARSGIFGEDLAAHYDESRGVGEDGVRRLTTLLVAELAGLGAVLEIGVGTGRVALPLAEAGIPIVGLDPSTAMLRGLVRKGGGCPPFGLLRGDGGSLPFEDAALGAAIFCHVLHLIPDWQGALAEAVRVLRADGKLLIEGRGSGEQRQSPRQQLRRHFHETLGWVPPAPIGVRDPALIDATLAEWGWRGLALPPVVATQHLTLGGLIDLMERGISSSELSVPPADRERGWAETRRWAPSELGPLDQTVELRRTMVWHVFRQA
jgi:SAM-dependent methyltransferase